MQLAFDSRQLILQLKEVRVGLELGIGLGHGEQAAEQACHLSIGLGRRLNAPGRQRSRAIGADLFEYLSFMRGISFHGFDEVGNEVGPSPELDRDPTEALLYERPKPHEPVVDPHDVEQQQNDRRENDPARNTHLKAPIGLEARNKRSQSGWLEG